MSYEVTSRILMSYGRILMSYECLVAWALVALVAQVTTSLMLHQLRKHFNLIISPVSKQCNKPKFVVVATAEGHLNTPVRCPSRSVIDALIDNSRTEICK